MRQVIRRFLKHLDAGKSASDSTIDTYRGNVDGVIELISPTARSTCPFSRSNDELIPRSLCI